MKMGIEDKLENIKQQFILKKNEENKKLEEETKKAYNEYLKVSQLMDKLDYIARKKLETHSSFFERRGTKKELKNLANEIKEKYPGGYKRYKSEKDYQEQKTSRKYYDPIPPMTPTR